MKLSHVPKLPWHAGHKIRETLTMKMHPLYPMIFPPQYKNYIWGGETIARRFNRAGTPMPCAESWEISTVPGNVSVVANGPFEGVALNRLVSTFGTDLVGTDAPNPEQFPLLFKILDAHANLSVQVHPDEAIAAALGGHPKHEMWYILDAEPETHIYAGFTPGANRENFLAHLRKFEAQPDQIYDITAGTCHALTAGALVYEIQQTSDTTYRLWDWGRDRELHTEQALQALDWDSACVPLMALPRTGRTITPRLRTSHFAFATMYLTRPHHMHTTAHSFMALFCVSGKTTLSHEGPHPLTLLPGDSVLIPANQRFLLHPTAPSHLLATTL